MNSGHGGITLGSEMGAGIQKIVRIKSNITSSHSICQSGG
jgi:polygalacturonase